MSYPAVRPERTIEQYSRGAELVRAVQDLLRPKVDTDEYRDHMDRAGELADEYDLTPTEFMYWLEQVRALG